MEENHYCTYEDFKKLDMRIGKILAVEVVPDTDKLLKCTVDVGEENPRTIVSGIRGYLDDPEDIVGKKVLYIVNLEPRVIRGIESQGMLMAIGDESNPFSFMVAEQDVAPGSQIR